MPNPTRWLFNFLLGLLILGIAAVLMADDPMPDYGAMDRDVLVILAQRQHQRIEQLELENAELREAVKAAGALHDDGVTLIPDGVWIVTVESVGPPDTTAIEAELHKLRGTQPAGSSLAGGYEGGMSVGGYGPATRQPSRPAPVEYGSREQAGRDQQRAEAEREKRGKAARIRALESRLRDAADTAIITGKTELGLPVTITARGVKARDGLSLIVGQTYTVTGRGAFTAFDGKIDLKTAGEYLE